MARLDPHSYNDDQQPETVAFDWKARVDFASRTIAGEVTLHLEKVVAGAIDLDTRDLAIESVTDGAGGALEYTLAAAEPILGARLRVMLGANSREVSIRYRTAPGASALQWLEPAQTAGGKRPFLFSQCQAIHARSVLPLQDTPRLRVKYRAELTVPGELRGLMAAAFIGREEKGGEAIERWEMPQPIPPYLLAFAVGELVSRDVGPRSRVWAEPSLVEAAAWEFAGVDRMLAAGERLFGAYDWERFDILTMPPSFPYGGMENPRLTFLTPTLLAGDRSLVNVVAHELAHSWTGNLVTSSSAEHFWLNEGWTVFAERRIVEALDPPGGGAEAAALHAALGRRSLERAIAQFAGQPELTRLRTRLEGVDPDEAFSQVPYEKGYLFLRALEEAAGRAAFDRFVRKYMDEFRFQAITTEQFVAFAERELPEALAKVGAAAWIEGEGVPAGAPAPVSTKLEAIGRLAGGMPGEAAARFTPAEWQLYLEAQPRPATGELCAALDAQYRLTESRNYEVLVTWLELAAESGWAPALDRIERVLGEVGRMKYLKPLYKTLAAKAPERAKACFAKHREGYHPIARMVVEGVLARQGS